MSRIEPSKGRTEKKVSDNASNCSISRSFWLISKWNGFCFRTRIFFAIWTHAVLGGGLYNCRFLHKFLLNFYSCIRKYKDRQVLWAEFSSSKWNSWILSIRNFANFWLLFFNMQNLYLKMILDKLSCSWDVFTKNEFTNFGPIQIKSDSKRKAQNHI